MAPDIQINLERVKGSTGCFEVILTKDGQVQLLHSKLGGEGFITNDNKNQFLDKLKAAL